MSKVSTPERIGELNRNLILEYIRKHGPVSRADITRSLEMSFPAVSSNVKSLLDLNYVYETGAGDNSLGRKSTLLRFNAHRGYVIGADIGRSKIRVLIADLLGDEIGAMYSESKTETNGEAIIAQLTGLIRSAVERSGIEKEKILCVSVGVPGIVDAQTGDICVAPFIEKLSKNDIVDAISKDFAVPILVENSVKYGAIGEKWRGAAHGHRDIFYLNYGVGLGAALILGGELYRGSNGAAGEVGFMVLEREAMRKKYDEEGVLEKQISGNSLNERLGRDDALQDVVAQYRQGDSAAVLLINEIVDRVGMMLINVASLLNLELIVLSGGLGKYLGDLFLDKWQDMLQKHIPFAPEIRTSHLLNRANVLGAVAVALRFINEFVESESSR